MSDAAVRAGLTDRTVEGIREALNGRMRWHSPLLFAGPAVIASIAYMDPGDFATNIQAGAKYGYSLLWVVLIANVVAMLYQALSAKLGIVTGRNFAEMSRDHFPQPVVWALWIISEVAAMATDLAGFLGGAIGLSLLLHVSLIAGMGVTAVLTYGNLMFDDAGFARSKSSSALSSRRSPFVISLKCSSRRSIGPRRGWQRCSAIARR